MTYRLNEMRCKKCNKIKILKSLRKIQLHNVLGLLQEYLNLAAILENGDHLRIILIIFYIINTGEK